MKIRVVFAALAVAVALVYQAMAADMPKAPAESTNKAASVAAPAPATDEVVARVNGTEIKRKELSEAVQAFAVQMARQGRPIVPSQNATLQHDILEELVGRELLLQEGGKHIPADIEKKVQEQVDQMKMQAGGEDQFNKSLAEAGIAPADYARRVHDNIIIRGAIQTVVDKEVKISPEDARAFYDKNPDQFKQPEVVRASHILIRCAPDASDDVKKGKRAQIEAARSLVKNGEKFADIARKVSEDPGTAQNGGDLGYFPHGQMVPEFDAAAFSLKTNEVSDVITTRFGYHILLVTGRKPAQTMSFDEVKEELAKYLKERKGNDVTRTHVAELRKAGKVEVLLPAPAPMPSVETAPMQAPAPVPPAPVVAANPSGEDLKPQLKEFIDKSNFYCTDGIGRQVDRIVCTPIEINVLGTSLQDKQLIVKVKFKMKPVRAEMGHFRMSELFDSYDKEQTFTFQKFDTGWQILSPEPYSDGNMSEIRPRNYHTM